MEERENTKIKNRQENLQNYITVNYFYIVLHVYFILHRYPGLFPGKIAATVFSLKIEFNENTQGVFPCRRSNNSAGGLNFEI